MHWTEDAKWGVEQQESIMPSIKKYFGDDVRATKDQYSKYDAESDKYLIEIKSRKNKYNAYPTTMITGNKITNTDKIIILVFNFTDAIYYIDYDKERFDQYKKKVYSRSKLKFDYKTHIYIPITDLILVEYKT